MQTRSLRFGGIEAARGVAAMMVAAYHGARLVAQARYHGQAPAGGLFGDFNAGVDFFFVLSGFLITWVHWGDVGRPEALGKYATRRVTRIYPAYWIVLIPLMLARLGHLGSTAGAGPGWLDIVGSFFLLPNSDPPILGVAWTLVLEMFFYSLFAVAILLGRRIGLLAILWAILILAHNLPLRPGSGPFPASFILSPFNLEFLLGVGVACLLRRVALPLGRGTALVGALAFFSLVATHVAGWSDAGPLVPRLTFGLCAAVFVVGSVELERREDVIVPGWLGLLGAASYSVYLLHSIVEPVALLGLWPLLRGFSPTLLTLLLAILGIGGGILFHLLVEKPLLRVVRHWGPLIFGAITYGRISR